MKIKYKSIIIPDSGYQIMSVDLVSAEMLSLALLAECQELIDVIESGGDLHIPIAAKGLGKDPKDVTKEERDAAKIINYASNYGGSGYAIHLGILGSRGIDIPIDVCEKMLAARWEEWPQIPAWWDSLFNELESSMYLKNLFGRQKPFFSPRWVERKGVLVKNPKLEKNARAWQNQSTITDLNKLAQIRVCQKCEEVDFAEFLLDVHDATVVQYRTGCQQETFEMLQECYDIEIDAGWRSYKIPVSAEIGPNYGDLKEYTP